MAIIAMTEDAFLGGVAYFAEKDRVIDGVTINETAKPNITPVDNWDQFGCIKGVKFQSEKKDFGTKTCFDGTNYSERKTERVVRDEIMLSTQDMNEIMHRLQFGLAAEVTPGGAEVNAFATSDRKVWGWLKLQGHRVGTGTVAAALDAWGYLELEQNVEWKDGLAEPSLKFTVVGGSPLGTPVKFTAA